jgi:peptide-methionine (R)-S-oxide reductase
MNETLSNKPLLAFEKSEREWREEVTPAQYEALRKKGIEPPFPGRYVYEKSDGTCRCAACGTALFHSGVKFDSGTGWPSFTDH